MSCRRCKELMFQMELWDKRCMNRLNAWASLNRGEIVDSELVSNWAGMPQGELQRSDQRRRLDIHKRRSWRYVLSNRACR
jgi:hypothetical protein